MDRPSPVPCPSGLVVKKGSKARAITSSLMPVPVSVTQRDTYCPGGNSRSRAARVSSHLLAVSMVSLPPSGMASRALMHKFSSALSSCDGSTRTGHKPPAPTTSIATFGPMVRRSRSSMPPISLLASSARGSRVWRREKAKRRCVSAAARLADSIAAFRKRSTSLVRPSDRRYCTRSSAPVMPCSRLLKSCAMPPVSWPTASIFCAWRNCSSKPRRSLTSRAVTVNRRRPPSAGMGVAVASMAAPFWTRR